MVRRYPKAASEGSQAVILKDRARLAKLMKVENVSQRQLAMIAGWKSHTYVHRLLTGESQTVDMDPALRIAHRLGVTVDSLFAESADELARRRVSA